MIDIIRTAYISALAAAFLAACSPVEPDRKDSEFVIGVDARELEITTKATAVTSVPGTLWWCATSGASGSSESVKFSPSQGSVSAGKLRTGEYQGTAPSPLNWYLSNAPVNFSGTGPYINVTDAGTDIVAGCAKAEIGTTPSVALKHIFARTGTLTFNAQSGYAVSGVSWKISRTGSGTSGTYNIASGAWTAGTTAMGAKTITSSSDLYLLPGAYTFTITYTLSKDHYSQTFTRSGTATLVQGKVNSITATATGGNAVSISVSTSLSAWTAGPEKELVLQKNTQQ